MDSSHRSKVSSGFTIIEVLVVAGIILLLSALLLPAIQAAREQSSRAQCLGNLKQIGTALSAYEAANGCYPHTVEALRAPGGQLPTPPAITIRYFSVHARLLPYLDRSVLFDSINFQLDALPPRLAGVGGNTDGGNAASATAIRTVVSTYLCPSDSFDKSRFAAPVSYRCAIGVGPYPANSVEFPDSGDGAFGGTRPRRIAELTDGLSQTVTFSERLIGDNSRPTHPSLIYIVASVGTTADSASSACSSVITLQSDANAGSHWYYSGTEYTWYNHVLTPNSEIPDCAVSTAYPLVGAFTARSRHPGGVNVVLADGSARFVGQSLDAKVWRALATKGNNDLGVISP